MEHRAARMQNDRLSVFRFARTPNGEAMLRAGAESLSIRERTCLRLSDGNNDFRKLISQGDGGRQRIRMAVSRLLKDGLIEPVHEHGSVARPSETRVPHANEATDVRLAEERTVEPASNLVGAKLALLDTLKAQGLADHCRNTEVLTKARSLRELAEAAQSLALDLKVSVGPIGADHWWQSAKTVLTQWRETKAR